jgi:hypothetical protein
LSPRALQRAGIEGPKPNRPLRPVESMAVRPDLPSIWGEFGGGTTPQNLSRWSNFGNWMYWSERESSVVSVCPVGRHDKPFGRMVMTIFAGFAEFEGTLTINRTNDGSMAVNGTRRCLRPAEGNAPMALERCMPRGWYASDIDRRERFQPAPTVYDFVGRALWAMLYGAARHQALPCGSCPLRVTILHAKEIWSAGACAPSICFEEPTPEHGGGRRSLLFGRAGLCKTSCRGCPRPSLG